MYTKNIQRFEIIDAGLYTTIQDYPGRGAIGGELWSVGIPPSGPMDSYAFRLANLIVGNPSEAAGLETTISGPQIKFHTDTVIAVTGAQCTLTLDGQPVPLWAPIIIEAGQIIHVGRARSGVRNYIAIKNGINVPKYLGSCSTLTQAKFGGFNGRILQSGDILSIADLCLNHNYKLTTIPQAYIPNYPIVWNIKVLYGPYDSLEFFHKEFIHTFFKEHWRVHHNSNRSGIRLIGPKPSWSRASGGEAGLHPSNVHDYNTKSQI